MLTFFICGLIALAPYVFYFTNKKFFAKFSFGVCISYMIVSFFASFGVITYGAMELSKEKFNENYANGEVVLYHKDNGCTKFKYYDDVYYRCNHDTNIDFVTETYSYSCGKTTCTRTVDIPVKKGDN